MASAFPSGQFNVSSLVQPGVQTSYNRQPGERPPLHTSPAFSRMEAETEQDEWYKTDRFYQVVKAFHDNYAKQPEMTKAKQVHERFTKTIETELRKMDICKRLEYKGSSYEGVKVMKSPWDADLEFDILVVMVDGDKLTAVPVSGQPGFVKLYTTAHVPNSKRFVFESYVVPGEQFSEPTTVKFFGALQKCINSNDEMKNRVILRRHGPTATQMDVYSGPIVPGRPRPAKLYSVDMVPSYEVGGKIYLAKPLDDGGTMVWRECFSLQEKAKLNAIDRDNGCRKQVLRVLKALRNGRPELLALSSYYFKTALFYVVDEKPSHYNWMFDRLGVRVVDVLKKVDYFLERGFMPLYYLPQANLFHKFSKETITNLHNRVHDMCTRERTLTNMMQFHDVSLRAAGGYSAVQ